MGDEDIGVVVSYGSLSSADSPSEFPHTSLSSTKHSYSCPQAGAFRTPILNTTFFISSLLQGAIKKLFICFELWTKLFVGWRGMFAALQT